MEKIIEEMVSSIKNTRYVDKTEYGFYENARIPYSNKAIDEKNKVAGFILLNEIKYADGMSWQEGVYGLYVVENKVIGGLLSLEANYYIDGKYGNYHYRFVMGEIRDGILIYTQKYTQKIIWGTESEVKINIRKMVATIKYGRYLE